VIGRFTIPHSRFEMKMFERGADSTKEVVYDEDIVEVCDAQLAERSDVDGCVSAKKPVFEIGKGYKVEG